MDEHEVTLPEELLLLAHDPVGGQRRCQRRFLRYGLAGAALAELELAGRITGDRGRVFVVNPLPTGDPLLDELLETLRQSERGKGSRGVRAQRWIRGAARHIEEPYLHRMLMRGALRMQEHRILGVFPHRRYPVGAVDLSSPAAQRLDRAVQTRLGSQRTRLLAAFASATDIDRRLYPGFGARRVRRELRRLAHAEWTAHAVHRLVAEDKATAAQSGDGGGGG